MVTSLTVFGRTSSVWGTVKATGPRMMSRSFVEMSVDLKPRTGDQVMTEFSVAMRSPPSVSGSARGIGPRSGACGSVMVFCSCPVLASTMFRPVPETAPTCLPAQLKLEL